MKIQGNTVEIDGTLYQLSQVNSVQLKPGRFRPVAFCCACVLAISFVGMAVEKVFPWGSFAVAVLLFLIAVWRVVEGLITVTLEITMSSGQVVELESTDKKQARVAVDRLTSAIANR